MYQYTATVIRVVDGDTVWLDVDLGFDVRRKDSFRLWGVNAPEMRTPEGVAAKAWLEETLKLYPTITVKTIKDKREKYGRYLAVLWGGTQNINESLVSSGHAVEYHP